MPIRRKGALHHNSSHISIRRIICKKMGFKKGEKKPRKFKPFPLGEMNGKMES
jgi:hypothetical protein